MYKEKYLNILENYYIMTAFFELVFFMTCMVFIAAMIGRICQEGDYDDFD